MAPNLGASAKTFASAQSGNLLPNSGSMFASFNNSSTGDNYYYTNGIWMDAGITYSASLWYMTDFSGGTNWSNLEMLLGTAQSTAGLTQIASVGPAVSPFYKPLSNTFTVATSGMYYVAIKATGGSGGAQNLVWDDLRIDIPCQAGNNTPVLTVSANNNTICAGEPVILTANGGHMYQWNTGATSGVTTEYPGFSTSFNVTGTNTLTGCSAMSSIMVIVKPGPVVSAFAMPPAICPGSSSNLQANGANQYLWSTTGNGANISVSPASPSTYTVIGTALNGCTGKAVVSVGVFPQPLVTGTADNNDVCAGDMFMLSGTGAVTYNWVSTLPAVVLQGQQVSTMLWVSSTYTVTGTDANGCTDTDIVSMNVQECTGLSKLVLNNKLQVFPNPTAGDVTVAFTGGEASINVVDVTGRLVYAATASEPVNINLSGYSAGVYYAKISINGVTAAVKIIKE
jgi:hypothetical protein